MNGVFSAILDLALIGLLGFGIYCALRLSRQLAGLNAGRAEMERFVLEFGTTVQRAEAGIQGLKMAARTGGDDLEQLIDKAQALRDELHFLVASADQIATRLSDTAAATARLSQIKTEIKQERELGTRDSGLAKKTSSQTPNPDLSAVASAKADPRPVHRSLGEGGAPAPASAAERDLLKVLGKLG